MLVPNNTPRALVEVEFFESHLVTKCAISEMTIQLIVEKFSKIISPLDVLCKMTIELTFKKFDLFRATHRVPWWRWKFSKVISPLIVLDVMTIQLTAEKFSKVIFPL